MSRMFKGFAVTKINAVFNDTNQPREGEGMRIIIALLMLIAVGCADKKDQSEITVIPANPTPEASPEPEPKPEASPEPEGKKQSKKIKLNFEGMHYPVSTPPEKAKAPQPRMISIPMPIEDRVQNKFNSLSETILIVPNGVPSIDDPAAVAPSNWMIDETPAPIEIDTPSIFPQFIDIVVEDTPDPRQAERKGTIIQVISPDPEPANLPETVNGILPLGRR